ncbi:polyprenyl synthetase family protein [Niallia oryzisoli]|uniref:Polyprenyl synthetase family protein n=1 Tax=Niallia oryzisoli TaxID=1737571 RepID=A0ABZ2CHD6_9BACI
MASLHLDTFSTKYKQLLEDQLRKSIDRLEAPEVLKDAMHYSLEAGGKRIRPLLLFATLHAFQKDPEIGLNAAAAIEMVHTYSLIHDDLPSMDNDDLRRGKPTNHKVFGEANAILAGDALLTYSFQLMAETPDVPADAKLALVQLLAQSSGAEGMVAGQVADMLGEEKELNLAELEYIHIHKTGKMLTGSVLAGAILSSVSEEEWECLERFSHHLGLAFQIRDDLLDIDGDEELIGKPVGSDVGNHKTTYPSLLGIKGAQDELWKQIELAKDYLLKINKDTQLLQEITDLVENRKY